jgi:hypothetical protein
MVLCLKCAEALTHMIFFDGPEKIPWFPESLLVTQKRLDEVVFDGRKDMKAPDMDT